MSNISKKILLNFFVLLYIFLKPSTIQAVNLGFYSTITFSIDTANDERVRPYRPPYNISGVYTEDILRNTTIEDLTNDEYKTRIYNKYERVSVRPLAKIDVGYYWFNNTQEEVNIEKIRIPMSRQIVERGDLTELVYDLGFDDDVTCTTSRCRWGKYLELDGIGLVSPQSENDLPSGIKLATFTVRPPVEITDYEIQYQSEYTSQVVFKVRNNTKQYLNDVLINYKGNVDIRINLESFQEIEITVFKKCLLEENQINCGPMKIKDPNTKTHCVMYGSAWGMYNNMDSVTVFNKIEGEWVSGSQTQPTMESFCIQRLPYIFTTDDMIAYIEIEEPEITDEQYWQELLNIDILPITSYRSNRFDEFLTLLKPIGVDNLKVL